MQPWRRKFLPSGIYTSPWEDVSLFNVESAAIWLNMKGACLYYFYLATIKNKNNINKHRTGSSNKKRWNTTTLKQASEKRERGSEYTSSKKKEQNNVLKETSSTNR